VSECHTVSICSHFTFCWMVCEEIDSCIDARNFKAYVSINLSFHMRSKSKNLFVLYLRMLD
jgi:hypothetical protein